MKLKCKKCGGNLITRPDDQEETIMNRLAVYHESTEILKNYYENRNKLIKINGNAKVEEISKEIFSALGR